MIAIDTNILVYSHRRESRYHHVASDVVRDLAESLQDWAIPWPCVYEFFSVVTSRRIWKNAASSTKEAWLQIEAWAGSPSCRLLSEPEDFLVVLEPLACRPRVRRADRSRRQGSGDLHRQRSRRASDGRSRFRAVPGVADAQPAALTVRFDPRCASTTASFRSR